MNDQDEIENLKEEIQFLHAERDKMKKGINDILETLKMFENRFAVSSHELSRNQVIEKIDEIAEKL